MKHNKGWRYESSRHALAARGIKSGTKVGPISKALGKAFDVDPKRITISKVYGKKEGDVRLEVLENVGNGKFRVLASEEIEEGY